MAKLSYGHCTNRPRCSLANNRESVIVPLDGRCPECGLRLASDVNRLLGSLPLLLVLAALAGGGYYLKIYYLDPGGLPALLPGLGPKPTPGPTAANPANPASNLPPAPAPSANPDTGVVDKPTFDTTRAENARARADVLARIDRMPNLTPGQKDKLRASVDKARGMGCVLIIPFEPGKTVLGTREGDLLAKAIASPGLQRLVDDPTLVLVILGYADKRGEPTANLRASLGRAQAVEEALKGRSGVRNVIYSVAMGGSDLFDAQNEARNRKVEVWAVFP